MITELSKDASVSEQGLSVVQRIAAWALRQSLVSPEGAVTLSDMTVSLRCLERKLLTQQLWKASFAVKSGLFFPTPALWDVNSSIKDVGGAFVAVSVVGKRDQRPREKRAAWGSCGGDRKDVARKRVDICNSGLDWRTGLVRGSRIKPRRRVKRPKGKARPHGEKRLFEKH
ncbi:Post-Gpi Attachment To Proteins Factor 6 [Manis pentadactyla]|nr:Post-Gpi Attachment To Proteins Factor 6 [Manis pentadactyla]